MARWFLAKQLAFKDPPYLKFHKRTDIIVCTRFKIAVAHCAAEYKKVCALAQFTDQNEKVFWVQDEEGGDSKKKN